MRDGRGAEGRSLGETGPTPGPGKGAADVRDGLPAPELARLAADAERLAREDREGHAAGLGGEPDGPLSPPGEEVLRRRALALWQSARDREARKARREVSEVEAGIAARLADASLEIDRLEHQHNELVRLRLRRGLREEEVGRDRVMSGDPGRALPTPVYASMIGFLALVEFLANAPVFSTLLPRDPAVEAELHARAAASEGWASGIGRLMTEIALRPDAALLAGGVVVFLCVLAHFFGGSLREMVGEDGGRVRRDTIPSASVREHLVPLLLSGVGLVLVLGVLFEARTLLGTIGEERFREDVERAAEMRRSAGWLRVQGDLVAAAQESEQALRVEETAGALREYSLSMSRMGVPILLLNLTLVLCGVAAAYVHRSHGTTRRFDALPWEEERIERIREGSERARDATARLQEALVELRRLERIARGDEASTDWNLLAQELERIAEGYRRTVFGAGRASGGRAEPRSNPARDGSPPGREGTSPGRHGSFLGLDPSAPLLPSGPDSGALARERDALVQRLGEVRARFRTVEAA